MRSTTEFHAGCKFFVGILLGLFLTTSSVHALDTCTKLKIGPPRGIQCLHCQLTPKFTPLLTQMLLNSCYQNLAVAYVLDGSFGKNFDVIRSQVNALRAVGREVYVQLYLLNGPAQRRFFTKTFSGLWNQTSPHDFRELILKDKKFQNKFQKFAEVLLPLIDELTAAGASVGIAPMLEDNLTNKSFSKLLSLIQSVIPNDVTYIRSACSDCFPGNQWKIPSGVMKEDHRFAADFDQTNGIISNDGWGYLYFNKNEKITLERPVSHSDRSEKIVSLSDLKPMLKRAGEQNNIFLLWISKYQQTNPGNRILKVNQRKFPKPKPSELNALSLFFGS